MNQGETSGGLSFHPLKRRRGRPRKDPSLKHPAPAHAPLDLDGSRQYHHPPRFDPTATAQSLVGQSVTGVIEATLDAGYLLNVRIGDSATNFRGIVFKPGHYVPVTSENDVAPHLQMIRRNDVRSPAAENLAIVQAGPRQKRKYKSRRASVVPHAAESRGNVVPVVLQPVNIFPNGLLNSGNQTQPRTGQVLEFGGDKDVHMVEPLSMLPPVPDRSIPAGQIFLGAPPHASHRVPPFNEGEKVKITTFTEVVEKNGGFLETSDSLDENGKGCLKLSTGEDESGTVSTGNGNEQFSDVSVAKNTFGYGPTPVRMTELLQVVEENKTQVPGSESTNTGAFPENESRVT